MIRPETRERMRAAQRARRARERKEKRLTAYGGDVSAMAFVDHALGFIERTIFGSTR